MATITTTIKEPKTFQQIQDQQRELGKEKALENLNNNIAKLIKTINDKSEKKITDDERQLKANQLALSKLQLRRAQLGLAKDEKSYSDYSVKYNSSHGIGSSIGVSQNSRDNAAAIALSAMTVGALNPVIVKEILLPPLKMMTRTVTGVSKALFSGLSSAGRRISGKTSSATEPDNEGKLHRKLDDILGAIKNKNKSSQKTEGKKEGFFSKLFGALGGLAGTVGSLLWKGLKGAIGAYLAMKIGEKIGPFIHDVLSNVVGEETADDITQMIGDLGPAMIAGYMIGGWKGALIGAGLRLAQQAFNDLKDDAKISNGLSERHPYITDAREKLNEYLPSVLQLKSDAQFEAAMAGLMLGGVKGMIAGYVIASPMVQKAIKAVSKSFAGIESLDDAVDRVAELKKGTILESIEPEILMGAIAGGALGLVGGPMGFAAGALLGAAGGFIWDRIKNKKGLEDKGIETEWSWSRMNYVIKGTNSTFDDYRNEIIGTGEYDAKTIDQIALENIQRDIDSGKIYENSGDSLFGNIANGAKGLAGWAGDKISEIGESMYNTAVEWCKTAIKNLADIDYGKVFGDIGDLIKNIAKTVYNKAVDLAKGAINWFVNNKEEIKNTVKDLGNGAVEFLKKMVLALYNTGVSLGEKAFDWFMENKSNIADNVLDLGSKAIEVLKDMCMWLFDKAKELGKKTIDAIKNIDVNPFHWGKDEKQILFEDIGIKDTTGEDFLWEYLKKEGSLIDKVGYGSFGNDWLTDKINKYGLTDKEREAFQKNLNGEDYDEGQLETATLKIINKIKTEDAEKANKMMENLTEEQKDLLAQLLKEMKKNNTLTEEANKNQNTVIINNKGEPSNDNGIVQTGLEGNHPLNGGK